MWKQQGSDWRVQIKSYFCPQSEWFSWATCFLSCISCCLFLVVHLLNLRLSSPAAFLLYGPYGQWPRAALERAYMSTLFAVDWWVMFPCEHDEHNTLSFFMQEQPTASYGLTSNPYHPHLNLWDGSCSHLSVTANLSLPNLAGVSHSLSTYVVSGRQAQVGLATLEMQSLPFTTNMFNKGHCISGCVCGTLAYVNVQAPASMFAFCGMPDVAGCHTHPETPSLAVAEQ